MLETTTTSSPACYLPADAFLVAVDCTAAMYDDADLVGLGGPAISCCQAAEQLCLVVYATGRECHLCV